MISARLLPRFSQVYPSLDPRACYPVVGEEPHGVWIEGRGIGDAFVNPGRLFVCRDHFELSVNG